MSAVSGQRSLPAVENNAAPVIRVTDYDRILSTLLAIVCVLVGAVWFLFLVWDSFHPHPVRHDQVIELVEETSGGVEWGSPTDSLKLDGTGPERADATPGESTADERPEVEEILKGVSLESPTNNAAGTVTSGGSDQLELDI